MGFLELIADKHYNREARHTEGYRCSACGVRYQTEDGLPIYYDGWKVCPTCRREMEEEEESA